MVLVLAAVAITAIRLSPPLGGPAARLVAGVLEERLGYEARVGSVGVRLAGLSPRLLLGDVVLSHPARRAHVLRLESLEVAIDLPASLRAGQPRMDALILRGARLSVRFDRNGRAQVEGLELLRGGNPAPLESLLRKGRLELVDSEIRILDARLDDAEMRLARVRLGLHNRDGRHLLALTAQPQPAGSDAMSGDRDGGPAQHGRQAGRLQVIGDLSWPSGDPRAWSGRLYAALDGGDVGTGLDHTAPGVGRVRADRVRLESWSEIRAGRVDEALVRLGLGALSVEPLPTQAPAGPLRLGQVAALVRARRDDGGWRVRVCDLAGRIGGGALPPVDLDLLLDPDWRAGRLHVASGGIDLGEAVSGLASSPWVLPARVRDLIEARPRGRIDRLAMRIDWGPERGARWATAASARGVGWDRVGPLPGVEGLSVQVRADQQGGEARLSSAGLSLDRRPLFSLPLLLDRFSARLDWQREAGGAFRVRGRDLTLEQAGVQGRARFALGLPAGGSGPELDLRASIREGDASRLGPYLPDGVMHPDLVSWLDRSIVSGRVPRADLLFRGPLAGFPFRDRRGRFELVVDFEDAELDYLPGWPKIEDASGRLRFSDQALAIELDRGGLYDSRVHGARAEIPDLWDVPSIGIGGIVEGPFADGLRVLAETPLSKSLGRLAGLLEVTGQSRLVLDLDVPLGPHRSLGVSGRLAWPGAATLAIKDTPLEIARMQGDLSFTEDRLAAEAIGADLWGQPLTLSLTEQDRGVPDAAATVIRLRSRTPVAELARRFPGMDWGALSGQLGWDLEVRVRHRDLRAEVPPLEYRLTSDLQGVSIDLPSPFGKAGTAKRGLELAGSLLPGKSMQIAGRAGDVAADISVDLGSPRARLTRGRVRFGAESAPPPVRDGLYLDGRLSELDLPGWWGRAEAVANRHSRGGRGHAVAWLAGADLEVERLSLGGPRLSDVALTLRPAAETAGPGGWEIDVRAEELEGRLVINPAQSHGLALALERLDLRALLAGGLGGAAAREATPDGRTLEALPALEVQAKELRWGEVPLGALELVSRTDPHGLRVPTLALSGGSIAADGEAAWVRSPRGGRSELSMRVETADTGAVLRSLRAPSRLEQAPLKAKLVLDWPGGLRDFSWARASGFVDLEVGAGSLPQVEPGLGRILGFLNLDALTRRLAMDFSDLSGEGFAFQEMKGRIDVADGQAMLDDFVIDGPSIKVLVSGPSDLLNERFDQTVVVEPKLGSSVALASAVAGGPVFGAAVYLVDRIAGNPLDRLGRYRYRITGPWRDPDLRPIGWDPAVGVDSARGAPGDSAGGKEPNHFLD